MPRRHPPPAIMRTLHRRPQPTNLVGLVGLAGLASIVLVPAMLASILLAPTSAAAQAPATPTVPPADAFDIRYYITKADGTRARQLAAADFTKFVNQARCQCGHRIETQVRLKATQGMAYDNTKLIQSFVGTNCGTAEQNPVGQFRKCGQINQGTAQNFVQGVNISFHPVWLTNGVDANSPFRDINNPETIAAGSCGGGQGESGVWVCAQTNGMSGCQTDEFFITGTQNANLPAGMSTGIQYDFLPPIEAPGNVTAVSGDSAVVLNWDSIVGDINGFRVLCEEADTGKPPPNKGLKAPALDAIPNGTVYFTQNNLCPGGPFSSYKGGTDELTTDTATTDDSGTTTDDTASTGGDSSGDSSGTTGDTTSGTGGTSGSSGGTGVCGDAVVDPDEECDDGAENGDDKACHLDCLSDICGDGFKGPEEECDKGQDNADTALCSTTCTLNTSAGFKRLDWDYVCTKHLAFNTKTVRIEGLENGKTYNFLLVAYDAAGNPLQAKNGVVSAAPVDTRDLWEQCKADGDVCGESGFCNVAGDSRGDQLLGLGAVLGLGLGLRGLIRRRRKRA